MHTGKYLAFLKDLDKNLDQLESVCTTFKWKQKIVVTL